MLKTILLYVFLFSILSYSYADNLQIGSYGRIGINSNLKGGRTKEIKVVSHSSRIEESPYQEIYFKYDFSSKTATKNNIRNELNFAIAFDDSIFHYNGNFKVKSAIRNFYLNSKNLIKGLNLWVGSRMYRGDDIYLLDFWPLDNLNTLGAGLCYKIGNTLIKFHTGTNRLDQGNKKDSYQLLYYTVPLRDKIGTQKIIILNRQKYIADLSFSHKLKDFKFKFYTELHRISKSDYKYENQNYTLPQDGGFLLGTQVTYLGFGKNNFIHLFFKYSSALAAYGELGIPYDLNRDNKTSGAKEILLGLSFNLEKNNFGIMAGSYIRSFKDADASEYDNDDISEGIVDIRFLYYISDFFHISTELSYQRLSYKNLDSITLKQEIPQIFKFMLLPTISPNGRGNYTQPKISLVYGLSLYNNSAEKIIDPLYLDNEEISPETWENLSHYIGITAQWWFNN